MDANCEISKIILYLLDAKMSLDLHIVFSRIFDILIPFYKGETKVGTFKKNYNL